MDPDRNDLGALIASRRGLHAVAERVLATDLYARTGHIGLRPAAGGVTTPTMTGDHGERQVRTDGAELVVVDGDDQRRAPLTTLDAAAHFVGVEPTGPVGVYTLVTEPDPEAPLRIDDASARLIADWLVLGGEGLAQLASAHADLAPSSIQLWPEHFDVALTMAEVNYGASPGDDAHSRPYLYVGPWAPRAGAFWNEPWGASVGIDEVADVAVALGFFEQGRAAAT